MKSEKNLKSVFWIDKKLYDASVSLGVFCNSNFSKTIVVKIKEKIFSDRKNL